MIEFGNLSADQLAARLSASAEDRAAFLRELAEADIAEAQLAFGQLELDAGRATTALGWFARAAAGGSLLGVNMVGRCYELGWGTPIDMARAADWYRVAALRGLGWGMYNYATRLALGEGVALDQAEALMWFRKADALGLAKAANFVGSFHEDGWATPVDIGAAARCYARAAAGGDFRGQFNHARMLIEAGQIDAAVGWLERAAEGGNDRFRAQAAGWLRSHPLTAIRSAAIRFDEARAAA